ncbi:MAG: hypothetical protein EBY20_03020 [Alphaproteobacteria bacterium]|jgi:hypothetical protein|uniref:Potassium channel domain-containing protein n=1 Tax=viral metagenome TaxID=1070528 RepID=A0A6C0HPP6_9ZZZZ|nr:hypothetical protein [Alphaproteobacteria bacterium]
MKQVLQTFLFQLTCIIIFGTLYWIFKDDFSLNLSNEKKNDLRVLDCFFTSVTVQAGVGYSILNPDTNRAVLLLMIQQLLMVFSNILMLYLFSIHLMSTRK